MKGRGEWIILSMRLMTVCKTDGKNGQELDVNLVVVVSSKMVYNRRKVMSLQNGAKMPQSTDS